MFTGIIESLGTVVAVETQDTNRTFTLQADFGDEAIRIDQSIAHDGVCLTVTSVEPVGRETRYTVTAIEETRNRTALGAWQPGRKVNIERCLRAGDRLDGHFVQGHVDATGTVESIRDQHGSWEVKVGFAREYAALVVEKGSICINGVSLTIVRCGDDFLTVAIIPYTWTHTTFHALSEGDSVNLEFDILGKYLLRAQRVGAMT